MAKLQSPRGTADLMPHEMAKHRHVMDTAREAAQLFDFQEIATPIFEFTEVFARPLGEGSDVVTKETYTFTDRGGESITLRPEGTAGVVRALISGGLTQTLPQKFYYQGPMFRYERPQKGRMRQFHQIGVEVLGVDSPFADADVIILGAKILQQLGILPKCRLHLNSLGDAESRQVYRGALVAYLSDHKKNLSEDSLRRLESNPLRILDSKDEGDRAIIADAPILADYLNQSSKTHFERVQDFLRLSKIDFTYDPKLVRGLDYYCHTAFEFITDALGAQGTVMGGGRYDGLAKKLGGPDIAGTGWAAGVERLTLLADLPPELPPQLVLIGSYDAEHQFAIETMLSALSDLLRAKKLRVKMLFGNNLGKLMKKADKLGAEHVGILGVDEVHKDAFIHRNMKNGEQEDIPRANAENRFYELINPEHWKNKTK